MSKAIDIELVVRQALESPVTGPLIREWNLPLARPSDPAPSKASIDDTDRRHAAWESAEGNWVWDGWPTRHRCRRCAVPTSWVHRLRGPGHPWPCERSAA